MQLKCDTKTLRGELKYNQAMKRMNSWNVGGSADCVYTPADADDFSLFLKTCVHEQPIVCLGLGSNVLIRDSGVQGIVISMKGTMDEIRQVSSTGVYAEAGVTCAKLSRYCTKHGLTGLEFLAGVPGTIGGALAMNAGAFSSEIWTYTEKVEIIERNGKIRICQADEFTIKYRQVSIPNNSEEYWFAAGYFVLKEDADPKQTQQRVKGLLQQRNESQPIGLANCGSVFKNPPNDYSARLIEECGLKGYVIGDAQVSDKHGNFIINRGLASADDIERLISHIQKTVKQKTGVHLELEIKVMGGDLC